MVDDLKLLGILQNNNIIIKYTLNTLKFESTSEIQSRLGEKFWLFIILQNVRRRIYKNQVRQWTFRYSIYQWMN